jgi:Transposase DDE domain
VLTLIAEHGLVKGERIGVDASTMEANAALKAIVRRETGETYREMLKRMAEESGIETPSAEDLIRMDRARKGKKLSNADWVSGTDPEAKIAKMKDGTTHLAYKPEHAVDLDTGAVVAAEVHPADEGDTTTLKGTLQAAETNLARVGREPSPTETAELVADKGYHSRGVLKDLDGGAGKTRIAEPQRKVFSRWHGDEAARRAVYANRNRLRSSVGKAAMRRDRRAVLRPQSGARRHAPDLAQRARERPQALPHSRRWPQPRHPDAPSDRRRHAEGGRRPRPGVAARRSQQRHPGDRHRRECRRRRRPRLRHPHHRSRRQPLVTAKCTSSTG